MKMNGDLQKQRFEILLIAKCYQNSKRIIRESEQGIIPYNHDQLQNHYRIVMHIENITDCMAEKERLIIQKEVLETRTGKWYLEYISAPSYYRHRKKAYTEFLNCL